MFRAEEDSGGHSGPSQTLQAAKQAACSPVSLDKLIRWSSPRGATAGEHYHFEGSQKTDTFQARKSQKEAI